jgi:hypothetical protein
LKYGANPNDDVDEIGNTHFLVATAVSLLKRDIALIPLMLMHGGDPCIKRVDYLPSPSELVKGALNLGEKPLHRNLSFDEALIMNKLYENRLTARVIRRFFEKHQNK